MLPYDSKDQVTSGVLVDSVASGRPIVATAFPHAVELLGSGAGTVVAHEDRRCAGRGAVPAADRSARRRFHGHQARGLAPAMAWPVVASAYVELWRNGSSPHARHWHDRARPPVFAHLLQMTDHRATFEHACMTEPRREHGYCTDDMARVLVVATREPDASGAVNGLAGKALQFLNDAQSYDGSCRNRMDRAGNWTDQPTTGDHWGRCIWGLGTAAAHSGVSLVRRLAVDPVRARRQGQVAVAAGDGARRRRRRRTPHLRAR